jgi:signal transduction histidine kinase
LPLTPLPALYTSRLYLQEILQNFITNAIKYTKTGGITLSAGNVRGGVRFAVADTGIGINTSDLKKIFDKFFRSEDYRTRENSGTGLGLYVTQKLAKKVNAKIEVESKIDHGSTFYLTVSSLPEPAQRTRES